jgi:hypothetical protein
VGLVRAAALLPVAPALVQQPERKSARQPKLQLAQELQEHSLPVEAPRAGKPEEQQRQQAEQPPAQEA